jgi:hypothetical protein
MDRPKWQAEKGQLCGYGMDISGACKSQSHINSRDVLRAVAVRQLLVALRQLHALGAGSHEPWKEFDHQIMISEVATGVKEIL